MAVLLLFSNKLKLKKAKLIKNNKIDKKYAIFYFLKKIYIKNNNNEIIKDNIEALWLLK